MNINPQKIFQVIIIEVLRYIQSLFEVPALVLFVVSLVFILLGVHATFSHQLSGIELKINELLARLANANISINDVTITQWVGGSSLLWYILKLAGEKLWHVKLKFTFRSCFLWFLLPLAGIYLFFFIILLPNIHSTNLFELRITFMIIYAFIFLYLFITILLHVGINYLIDHLQSLLVAVKMNPDLQERPIS